MHVVSRGGERRARGAVARTRDRAERRARAPRRDARDRAHAPGARAARACASADRGGRARMAGARAPRLLLHARSIAARPPDDGDARSVSRRRSPIQFDAWLASMATPATRLDDDDALSRWRDRRALRRRWGLAMDREGERATTCFRCDQRGGRRAPAARGRRRTTGGSSRSSMATAVRRRKARAVATPEAGRPGPTRRVARASSIASSRAGFDGVYLKVRPKQANTLVDTRRDDFAPRAPVLRRARARSARRARRRGPVRRAPRRRARDRHLPRPTREPPSRARAREGGERREPLRVHVRVQRRRGGRGGVAHDQRPRARPRRSSAGARTCAEAGMLDAAEHPFIAEDAFAWLASAAKKKEPTDFVVLDSAELLDVEEASLRRRERLRRAGGGGARDRAPRREAPRLREPPRHLRSRGSARAIVEGAKIRED